MAEDTRRRFLLGAGLAGTAVAAGLAAPVEADAKTKGPKTNKGKDQSKAPGADAVQHTPPVTEPPLYLTLTATEAAFISAAADTFIPADEVTPSGTDCGLVTFVDRQLASAWGGGAKMYRSGPFRKAKAEYGYQLPLTPREYFATGIAATNAWTRQTKGKDFDRLSPVERNEVLTGLDQNKVDLGDFGGKDFLDELLTIVMDGFFSDPLYGGNRDKISWRMVGFPGLPALYRSQFDEYRGKRYVAEPKSIKDFS